MQNPTGTACAAAPRSLKTDISDTRCRLTDAVVLLASGRQAVVAGEWRVLFSTVTILGSRRTKLGLRGGVVTVDSLSQRIDPAAAVAENVVHFSLAGLGAAARGTLAVRARYSQAAARRVAIEYEASELQPEALERVLGANMDLLLKIFNPEVRAEPSPNAGEVSGRCVRLVAFAAR